MRTGLSRRSPESYAVWPMGIYEYVLLNHSFTKDSGFNTKQQERPAMLSRIYTFISDPESFSLSLSLRAAKRLNVSYWIFTALSCITFFTSHWSVFLASLIPALILLRIRVARKTLKAYYDFMTGDSTNGT